MRDLHQLNLDCFEGSACPKARFICIGRIGKQTVPLELYQQLKRENLLASPAKAATALPQ